MSKENEITPAVFPQQTPLNRPYSALERILGYLVFEGHSARIGLELSLCVVAYSLMRNLIPWDALGIPLPWAGLSSWFFCCALVLLLDQLLLCSSAHAYRRAYLLGLHEKSAKALELIDSVGPKSAAFIRIPPTLYHLQRAELLAQLQLTTEAMSELEQARTHGIKQERFLLQKLQILRSLSLEEQYQRVFNEFQEVFGQTPELLLEQIRAQVASREQLSQAKRLARRVIDLPENYHYLGESCHVLARAYEAVCMLWTGEAEDGLPQLTAQIERVRSSMLYIDTLRPIFAELLLERSLYLATHKQPTPAVYDYTLSRALCSSELHRPLSEHIRCELADRYAITLS